MVAAGGAAIPRGRLRVSASVAFGVGFVVPLIPDFLTTYPEIELDVSLTDSVIDIVGERADIAIRAGTLRDSSLKARKLLESRRVVVASPTTILSGRASPDTRRSRPPQLPDLQFPPDRRGLAVSRSGQRFPFRQDRLRQSARQ